MNSTFFKNYRVKLVVLMLAIFLWFYVITEKDYEHVIEVPVRTLGLPDGKVVLNELPKAIKVKVKGNGKDLIALILSKAARFEVDLSEITRRKTFLIEPENVFFSKPAGNIEAVEIIMPDTIFVVLDRFSRNKIPISSQIATSSAPGYMAVGDMQFFPDSVSISGPGSLVSEVKTIATDKLEFDDLRFDLKKTVSLAPLESNKIVVSDNEVEIFQNIQKLLELTLVGVPVEVRNAPASVSVLVRPSQLSLVLQGGGDLLAQINKNDIVAYLDYNKIKANPGKEYPPTIEPPDGIIFRDVVPPTFKLVFERGTSN